MKSKLTVLFVSVMGLISMPLLASAQSYACEDIRGSDTLFNIVCKAGTLLSFVLPFIIALGVIIFVWGVIQYVIADDEEAKSKGRNMMIYGIIGLVVIVAMWGLVRMVTNTFGINTGDTGLELPDLTPQ